MYISTNACLMKTSSTNWNAFQGQGEEYQYQYLSLYAGLLFLTGNFFCVVMLLSPSTFFVMCIYLPISLISSTIYMHITSDFDDPLSMFIFQTSTISSFWALLVFYILQLRALKKFYQNQKLEKKEIQMTKVLDSQSDSIVVVRIKPEKVVDALSSLYATVESAKPEDAAAPPTMHTDV